MAHGDWVIYDGEQYIITGRSDDTLNIAGKRINLLNMNLFL